jgi:hypothetical protein
MARRRNFVKGVDGLTIGVEPLSISFYRGCNAHNNTAVAQAVVRHRGFLCDIAVAVCEDLRCPDAAIQQAREMALEMIPKETLKYSVFS